MPSAAAATPTWSKAQIPTKSTRSADVNSAATPRQGDAYVRPTLPVETTGPAAGEWDTGVHVADTYRSGNVFLAGDAAHQHVGPQTRRLTGTDLDLRLVSLPPDGWIEVRPVHGVEL